MQCPQGSACCLRPTELLAPGAEATCANATVPGADTVCDLETECFSRWVAGRAAGWLAVQGCGMGEAGRLGTSGWMAGGQRKGQCADDACQPKSPVATVCARCLTLSSPAGPAADLPCPRSADPCNAFVSQANCVLRPACVWRSPGGGAADQGGWAGGWVKVWRRRVGEATAHPRGSQPYSPSPSPPTSPLQATAPPWSTAAARSATTPPPAPPTPAAAPCRAAPAPPARPATSAASSTAPASARPRRVRWV